MAIIGSGIAGMSAAYFLRHDFDLELFEKNDYIGGHTNTIEVNDGEKISPMDTGFMVFNEKTYPNLLKLFSELEVPYENTDMSFSVRNDSIDLEYNGSSVNGLFAQRKNIFNFKFLKLIKDILKFNGDAKNMLANEANANLTIGQYVDRLGLSEYFMTNFLVPMSSAVWSTPIEKMKDFPAQSLVRFFENHGFVGVETQLQWKTVTGGSREYRNRLLKKLGKDYQTENAVESLRQDGDKIILKTKNGEKVFDYCVVATHGDEAYRLLENPNDFQKEVLKNFSYQENIATVHTDISVMPKLKTNWSSWNFLMRDNKAYTVYYMNRLQRISDKVDFFVNINGEEFIDSKKIISKINYTHPVFDLAAVEAQRKMDALNKEGNLFFTGSYYRYGFHEDALLSSVNLCTEILGKDVWGMGT